VRLPDRFTSCPNPNLQQTWRRDMPRTPDRAAFLVTSAVESLRIPEAVPAEFHAALVTIAAVKSDALIRQGMESGAAYASLPDWLCDLLGEILWQWDCD
jgi:hypothetical protein